MSLLRGAEALPAAVNAQLAALAQRGVLTAEELAAIDPGDILAFLRSDMGARMLASPRVQREWGFCLRDGDLLVQGVIDLCFLENGAWVLVDYKTDRCPAEELPAMYGDSCAGTPAPCARSPACRCGLAGCTACAAGRLCRWRYKGLRYFLGAQESTKEGCVVDEKVKLIKLGVALATCRPAPWQVKAWTARMKASFPPFASAFPLRSGFASPASSCAVRCHGAMVGCKKTCAAIGDSWRVHPPKGFSLRRGSAVGGGEV